MLAALARAAAAAARAAAGRRALATSAAALERLGPAAAGAAAAFVHRAAAHRPVSLLGFAAAPLGGGPAAALGARPHAPAAHQLLAARGAAGGPQPRFLGGKLKPYSSFKERFKVTGTGKIRFMRPGHIRKRSKKSGRHNMALGATRLLHETYAKTMRRLGFTMRHF